MIETTKVSPANTAKSLRTIIPMSIVKMLELDDNSHIEWNIKIDKGVMITFKKKA